MSPGKLVDWDEKDVGCQDKSGPGKIYEVILVEYDFERVYMTNIFNTQRRGDIQFLKMQKTVTSIVSFGSKVS